MENERFEKIIEYWDVSAEYDVGVAKSLFKQKKYHYSLFFGHLALEKILKAIYVKKKSIHAPLTHSLPYLAEKSGLELEKEKLEKLADFMEFYIEGRYPRDMEAIFKKCTRDFTGGKLEEIMEMFEWLRTKLKAL